MDEEDTGSRNSVVHKKIYRLSDLQQHEVSTHTLCVILILCSIYTHLGWKVGT